MGIARMGLGIGKADEGFIFGIIMQKTKIEWVKNPDGSQGYVWNPIKGLCPQACWYCYARRIYRRFKLIRNYKRVDGLDIGEDELIFNPSYEDKAGYWHDEFKDLEIKLDPRIELIRQRIFVCSTIEIFHSKIKSIWRDKIFEAIKYYHWADFIILTKLPENIDRSMPENVWLGVSCDGADWQKDDERISHLLNISKAKIKFISYEPILSPPRYWGIQKKPDWIILGKLTGFGKKYNYTPSSNFKNSVRGEIVTMLYLARRDGIPIFLKNNLKEIWGESLIQELPE